MRSIYRRLKTTFSAIALALGLAAPSYAATVQIEFNERPGPGLAQPGFSPFLITSANGTGVQTADSTNSFPGGINVSVLDVGGVGYDDRVRATPTNAGAFTQSNLLRELVFSRNLVNRGLDIRVTGLVPFGLYSGSLWSFDSASTGTRVSDWAANGVTFRNNYTFNGAVLPITDNDYRMGFLTLASDAGEITIRGRRDALSVNAAATPVSDFGVFVNAFELDHIDTFTTLPFPTLSVDFGPGASSLSGFHHLDLAGGGIVPSASGVFDGKNVTISGVGVNLQERNRTSPVNDAIFTQAELLQDFIFAETGAVGTTGLDIRVDGLTPGQTYLASIWSYDVSSTSPRGTTWTSDAGSINTQFAGEALPRTNDDYRATLFATADGTGTVLLSGRKSADGIDNHAVFVNALQLRAVVPEPTSLTLALGALVLGVARAAIRRRIQR